MATEKLFPVAGDVLYIIGKYSFSPDEKPRVVEVEVAYRYRKSYYTYPTANHGTFKIKPSDLGKNAFFTRAEAEAALAKMKGSANNA